MAYRYTNTDKWVDVWFRKLKPVEKLLFIYLCDNCDIAGFIEYDIDKWAFDIGYNRPQIEGAFKGLSRGLIFSTNNDCIYICNFLKHQKNLPLKENNNAHIGIIRRFELYSYKFGFIAEIEEINKFIEGATKGLNSPHGNGKGNGSGKGKTKKNELDFEFDKQFEPIIKEWFDYKKARKESYATSESRKKFYSKLYNMSDGETLIAQKIIDQSMANNWAGIFYLKDEHKQEPKQQTPNAGSQQRFST